MQQATFGTLLREARERARLTLEGLAAASGVSVRAIGDMERGRRRRCTGRPLPGRRSGGNGRGG
ncbi:helix-turn-helix domain-containing protein [Kitasatospora sp. NPDC057223]|uniref:helix-turn-helix domain-containing protein n=1 Tax=Kitasatospora sp. NPDC057223 TaxID=3346055 RepID=UPI00363EB140